MSEIMTTDGYRAERIASSLEKIAKYLGNINTELEELNAGLQDQNDLLEPLSGCVIDMGGDIKRLRINKH